MKRSTLYGLSALFFACLTFTKFTLSVKAKYLLKNYLREGIKNPLWLTNLVEFIYFDLKTVKQEFSIVICINKFECTSAQTILLLRRKRVLLNFIHTFSQT